MNAIGVANEIISLAAKENKDITHLGLMKQTYLAHGYSLAANNMPLLDSRYDNVEAWRYGPVIPSVYHTFKHHKNHPIKEMAEVAQWDDDGTIGGYTTPRITDERALSIITFVWNRYKDYTEGELVSMLHRKGTPWDVCYRENMNMPIPDEYTKLFYSKLIMALKARGAWKD